MNTSHQLSHHQFIHKKNKFPLSLLAHDFNHPANVGSLFRLADALGIEQLFLSGSTPQPPSRKIRKTSRGCENHVPYTYSSSPTNLIHSLKILGYRIICLEITTNSIPLSELQVKPLQKICLIPGSENHGVPQSLLDLADDCILIPMFGNNSSMNVSIACAIASYEIIQQLIPGSPL
ncbi:MAG: TrmH family RNA methyltransferase [bacterium]